MKNLILTGLVTLVTTVAQAKDLTLSDMKAIVPNMEQAGKDMSPSYSCEIKTEWLENGNLNVTALQSYKGGKPSKMEIEFTPEKNVEVYSDKYNDSVEYTISQSKVLVEGEDKEDRVDLYESFNFEVKNSVITQVHLQYAEVNQHSDPHEDSVHCYFQD